MLLSDSRRIADFKGSQKTTLLGYPELYPNHLFHLRFFQADLALIPKPYMPKLLWRDGKFVPNPLLKETGEEEKGEKKK